MSNNNNKIAITVILLLIVGAYFFLQFRDSSENKGMMTINLYDKDGNKIVTPGTFSIVNDIPNVASMDIAVNIKNTGATPLTCVLSDLSPEGFNTAMASTSKSVQAGLTESWTSSLMDVAQFEALTQPVTFSATATCSYVNAGTTTTLPSKTATIIMTITNDEGVTGSFDVSLASNAGGVLSVCGNDVCEASETPAGCPADCVVANYAKFRTSELDYGPGSAIAFGDTCGAALTKYGYISAVSATGGTCTDNLLNEAKCGSPDVANPIAVPGDFIGLYSSPQLYRGLTDTSRICICATEEDGAGTKFYYYDTDMAGTVSIEAVSIDSAMEVAC